MSKKFLSSEERAALDSDQITLNATEVSRMKNLSIIRKEEDIRREKRIAQEEKDKTRAVSIARKERMLKLEEERKKRVPPTETEQIKNEKDQATLSQAQYKLEEELDEVKRMNQMMLYSKCVTIRDAQIEEKKHIMEENEEEERRLDLMMELERIKALEAYEEREKLRAEERLQGRAVLMKQIEERALERQRQEELRDQDKKQMFAELERMKEEELAQQYEKRMAGHKLLQEVARANAAQIERKKGLIQMEKEEDARIARYIRERDLREQAYQEEQARIAHERELETARLRAQQEKMADKQAELDELRAMRAQEAYEREWREKERAEAERKMAINADLAAARAQQKNVKMKQMAEQARAEQEDFYRIIAAQREQEESEQQHAYQATLVRKNHKAEILNQIAQNEERRKKDRQEYLEEGAKLRQQAKEEFSRMERIKSRKLEELAVMGVPGKYRAELERKKVEV
eukprot:CAMPEP_0118935178 /NCGR_PEP_ID=MMETSP1169-20130426/15074_1 /TAXON_ID=36882 /ORGANISM="Pyramimonas obovata, Strain CCMP722" /LENGTH=462 /DNA_ID=CAMNT_0006878171 /DNA_START=303 /DNA_END=1691 /DNA_ORIENTATION=+